MKKITPNLDLQNSIQRDRILESRDFYKGKSFRYLGVWERGHMYFSDEWFTDFVSYEGALLACSHTHTSANEPELIRDVDGNIYGVQSSYWTFVLAGTPGPHGKVFSPIYNELTSELSWELTDGTEPIKPVVIKGKDAIQPEFKIEVDPNTGRSYLIQYLGADKTLVGEIKASAVRFANTLPPESEAKNYAGQILFVENDGEGTNDYLEYIAVRIGDANDYKWELVGGNGISSEQLTEITENITNISTSIKEIQNNITEFETRIENLENTPAGNAPLKEVRLNGQQLEFVYMTESGEQVVMADISDVITNEEVGAGLQEQNGSISVKIAHYDEYLMLTDEGLSVKGLDTKFEAVNQELTNISQEITEVKEIVQQVENIDGGEIQWQ